MKKIIFTFMWLFLLTGCANAEGRGYKYIDGGYIYTNVTTPFCAAKQVTEHTARSPYELKSGTSESVNIFYLIDAGDGGIYSAAKNGGVTKIHYVDIGKKKLFIPFLFFPIYVNRTVTTVYGE